ncbi:hypothetical protein ACHAXA_006527 [Cyclostephanos tholiformis]|uniref:AB hydrolase-1 domain-containing protein n=1 Tax=Cyclostephanos tholiformis TaxID=382380 RepID=A0ABD3RA83_9STRA
MTPCDSARSRPSRTARISSQSRMSRSRVRPSPLLLRTILAAHLLAVISSCDASFIVTPPVVGTDGHGMAGGGRYHRRRPTGKFTPATACDDECESDDTIDRDVRTFSTHHLTDLTSSSGHVGMRRHRNSSSWIRKLFTRPARTNDDDVPPPRTRYRFEYDYNALVIGNATDQITTGMILVHPIGVGIGRWYYDRLLSSLRDEYGNTGRRTVVLVPDLLGSATASGPTDEFGDPISHELPLLNVTDWTRQISHLMAESTRRGGGGNTVGRWAIVANGGCSSIALRVAAESSSRTAPFGAPVTNVVISSPPGLSYFLDGTDPMKVRESYRALSGIVGGLFWWYSLRDNGRFVREFSERNLVGNPDDLGHVWTPNCLSAASLHGGRGRYSTFAFLAGALRDGCGGSLDALRGRRDVRIDLIRGTDTRRNRARSWFWTRKKNKRRRGRTTGDDSNDRRDVDAVRNDTDLAGGTIRQYLQNNGNRGTELFVGGRISLAWEDPNGYAKCLMELVSEYET